MTGSEPQPAGPEPQVDCPEHWGGFSNSWRPVSNPRRPAASDSPTARSLRAWRRATPGTPRCPGTARRPRFLSEARGEGATARRREAQPLPPRSPRPEQPAAAPADGLPGKHGAELTCWRPAADLLHSPQSLTRSSLRPRSAAPQLLGVAESLLQLPPKPDRAVCVASSPVPSDALAYSWCRLHAGSCSSREKGAAPHGPGSLQWEGFYNRVQTPGVSWKKKKKKCSQLLYIPALWNPERLSRGLF